MLALVLSSELVLCLPAEVFYMLVLAEVGENLETLVRIVGCKLDESQVVMLECWVQAEVGEDLETPVHFVGYKQDESQVVMLECWVQVHL